MDRTYNAYERLLTKVLSALLRWTYMILLVSIA